MPHDVQVHRRWGAWGSVFWPPPFCPYLAVRCDSEGQSYTYSWEKTFGRPAGLLRAKEKDV